MGSDEVANIKREVPCGQCEDWYDTIDCVDVFHHKFHVGEEDKSHHDMVNRRIKLIKEEAKEVTKALDYLILADGIGEYQRAMVDVLKELCDLQYVLDGTLIELQITHLFEEAFLRVHESNMSKLDKDGQPIKNKIGKILKGPNYKEADLDDLMEHVTIPN